jgi:hypothetical protein
VSSWKIILATLVIFGAGVVTGVFVEKANRARNGGEVTLNIGPSLVQERFLERMRKELALTDDQFNCLEVVFRESRERMAVWWLWIEPELEREMAHVREEIRGQLNSEQRDKFAKLLREQRRSAGPPPGDKQHKDRRPGGTRGSAQTTNKTSRSLAPVSLSTNLTAPVSTNAGPTPR